MRGRTIFDAKAYSVASATSRFARTTIQRHDPSPHDVQIETPACPGTRSSGVSRRSARREHDLHAYLHLLRRGGNLTLVGAPNKPYALSAFGLIFGNKSLAGSLIGGIQATQEMLDFCGEHGITSDVEVIPIQKLDEAYERRLRSDVKYRFSIDVASLKRE